MNLYTKNGRPLQVSGEKVYSQSGTAVGRIRGDKVFGTDGRYVGSIVGDRLVYRSTQSAGISSSFSAANRAGSAQANRAGSSIYGETSPTFQTEAALNQVIQTDLTATPPGSGTWSIPGWAVPCAFLVTYPARSPRSRLVLNRFAVDW